MSSTSSWTTYEERLGRVTAYLYDHLDEELDLNRLAEVACLSPYHWHRIYHATRGETIAATVKRLRLHRAAGYLAHTAMPIEEIARKSGYRCVPSFNRAFGSAYGMPPARYRRGGDHTRFQSPQQEASSGMYDIAIREVPAMTAVAVEHVGSYMQIGKAFDTLYTWLGARGLIGPGGRSVGVYLDDPSAVAEDELRSRACILVEQRPAIAPPIVRTEVAGGDYAVLRHVGPYASMKAAYQWLYGDWLVRSGREAADAPVFEAYLNSPRDTAPAELMTDIYLPLRRA